MRAVGFETRFGGSDKHPYWRGKIFTGGTGGEIGAHFGLSN